MGLLVLEQHLDSPLFLHRRRIELVALYVIPNVRGRGLARRMMHEAVAWTARRGEDGMQLYVTVQNEPDRAFYHSCGWYPVQEIWHLDGTGCAPRPVQQIDPSRAHKGQDVLEHGHYHLALERSRDGDKNVAQ